MTCVLRKPFFTALVALGLAVLVSPALAEEVPIVDGTLWGQSSTVEKKAYLIGASNFIVLEHQVQTKSDNPPTPYQSSVPDFFAHTDDVTLDGAIDAIDQWYENNPGDSDTPVLTVLWKAFVEPEIR